jgi:hypothetical protein
MSKIETNRSNFAALVIDIANGKDKAECGPFALIFKAEQEVQRLMEKHEFVRHDDDSSVRKCNLDFFASQPEGDKMLQRYADLVAMKSNASPVQKAEKARLKKRMNTVNATLSNTVDVYKVIVALRAAHFTVHLSAVPNTGAHICRIAGKDDAPGDFAELSVTQARKLATINATFDNLVTYASVQELAKSGKSGAPNKAKGNGDTVAMSQLSSVTGALDNAIAGKDIKPDNGMSPEARKALLLLAVRIMRQTPADDWQKAVSQFDAEADDAESAAA